MIVGLINVVPVVGVVSAAKLESMYGQRFEADALVLMRHRALLFGLVGAYIIVAAFRPSLRVPAFVFGFVSMLGFVALAGRLDGPLGRVVVADLVGSVVLLISLALFTVAR